MIASMELDESSFLQHSQRPKRTRHDSDRQCKPLNQPQKSLELGGIIDVLKEYHDYEGGINCSICGKLYKSKVCFTKHLWEHSIYWDQFDGEKNQDRVLSIQAALILYSGHKQESNHRSTEDTISNLLVTSPQHHEKKRDVNGNEIRTKSPRKVASPSKRKKSSSISEMETRPC